MSYVDELVQCPYDQHHKILKSRLIVHLYRCKKQHPDKDFSICPFNASHHIPTNELKSHSEVCPDRVRFDSYLYVVGDEEGKDHYKVEDKVDVHSSENWDEEPQPRVSYLDMVDKINTDRPVLRRPVGKTKSERKQFYAEEARRLNAINRGEVMDDTTPASSCNNAGAISRKSPVEESRLMFVHEEELRSGRREELENFPNHVAIVLNRGRGRVMPSSTITKND